MAGRSLLTFLLCGVLLLNCGKTGQVHREGNQAPAQGASSKESSRLTEAPPKLQDQIRMEFNKTNPRIARIGILDVEGWHLLGPRVVVAWGIRPDLNFSGDFSDELFGVFLTDDSLTVISRVLDVFATPRWLDYYVRIQKLTMDSVIVVGEGMTYGDEPMRRAYVRP